MISSLVSALQGGAAVVLVVLVVGGALIGYALYRKGDVRAEFAHGKTIFKLEAKDRKGQ